MLLILTGWLLMIAPALQASEIKPFTTDGCSAFPDGTAEEKDLWLHCCTAHDRAYWQGGTRQERVEADEALRACVAAVGEEDTAELMLAGVRVGGTPYLPTSFRWGYGWPYLRGYKALSEPDRRKVEAALRAASGENTDRDPLQD